MTKNATGIVVSQNCLRFWSAARFLIDAAGVYAGRVKLKNNLLDSSTAWKVQDVFTEYYNGKMNNLDEMICHSKLDYEAKVAKFNLLCRQNQVTTIRRPDKLLNILLDERKRDSYKRKIKTRLKRNEICSLQEFEVPKQKK